MGKPKRFGRGDSGGRRRLPSTGQNVDHDVAAHCALGERLGACRFHRLEPVGRHRRQDADHLAITVGMSCKPPLDPFQRGR